MTIDKSYGEYYLVCDTCEAAQVFDEWDEAVDYAKENGWRIRKRNGEWEHTCPDCQDAEMGLTND